MKNKILGVLPIVAMLLFSVFLAVGDYQASAANPVGQTATVTVNPNIAITVPTAATMTADDGTTATSNTYDVNNVGNVQVHIYVRADAANFVSGTSIDTIPITGYQIKNQGGGYVTLTTGDQKITTTKLNTPGHGSNVLSIDQTLAIPAGTEAATYTNSLTYTAMTS